MGNGGDINMMLHEAFDLFGKPFPYYPQLCHRLYISVNACVFLCYVAWRIKPDEEWVHISSEIAEKQTGMSVKEQATARKSLLQKKCIVEDYRRLTHQMFYKLGSCDLSKNLTKTPENSPNAESANGETPNGHVANSHIGKSSNEGINRTIKEPALSVPIPAALQTEGFKAIWIEWVADRRQRRKPMTERAAKLQLEEMRSWGEVDAIHAIKKAIASGWQKPFKPNGRFNGKEVKFGQSKFI